MIQRAISFLVGADESDVLLCIGMESLFVGLMAWFPPAAYIVTGALFIGLAALVAKNGDSFNTI